MNTFLGPAQALAVVPFCTDGDVAAWAATQRAVQSALTVEQVWRVMLLAHFRPPLELLGGLSDPPETPEVLASLLPQDSPKQVYASLRKTSAQPFVLEPRARLLLEIHEIREWDRHQRQFTVQRQAECLARALGRDEAAERLCHVMAPEVLELISLQAMMGGGKTRLQEVCLREELSKVRWSPNVNWELRQLMEKRSQRRRMWWQRQRDYLLQDLERRSDGRAAEAA